jgi:hypothetical protein
MPKKGGFRPLWPKPSLRPPMAKRAFGHPLPSAYGRGWLPLAIGDQRGEAGERY